MRKTAQTVGETQTVKESMIQKKENREKSHFSDNEEKQVNLQSWARA